MQLMHPFRARWCLSAPPSDSSLIIWQGWAMGHVTKLYRIMKENVMGLNQFALDPWLQRLQGVHVEVGFSAFGMSLRAITTRWARYRFLGGMWMISPLKQARPR